MEPALAALGDGGWDFALLLDDVPATFGSEEDALAEGVVPESLLLRDAEPDRGGADSPGNAPWRCLHPEHDSSSCSTCTEPPPQIDEGMYELISEKARPDLYR